MGLKRVAKPILDKYVLLETNKRQKFHDDTPASANEQDSHYLSNSTCSTIGPLSEKSLAAANIFVEYAFGEQIPPIPNDENKFHFENDECVGFLNIGKEDMAHMWHMIVIPKLIDDEDPPIRWIFDLEKPHVELLHKMRKSALTFISHNRKYFEEMYPDIAQKWLKPEYIRIGFQTIPAVAYLTMHVLVGPITDFGNSCAEKWIPFEKVTEYLIQNKDMNVLTNSYRVS